VKSQKSELNRRDFLSTLTTAAGLLALGLSSSGASAAQMLSSEKRATGKRVGISDAAYKKAWKRAQELVGRMTLEEKICQLGAGAHFGAGSDAIERLNIPRYDYASGEALHGVHLNISIVSTSFPVPLAMAAGWDPELVRRAYNAVSDEARAYDNRLKIGLSYYSPPTLNLHRDPRWGRCYEAPGEDPCLAGTIAVQVVRGMQGDSPYYLKTTACSKHYICNNTDADRTRVSPATDVLGVC
jgi:beta-glucosidase